MLEQIVHTVSNELQYKVKEELADVNFLPLIDDAIKTAVYDKIDDVNGWKNITGNPFSGFYRKLIKPLKNKISAAQQEILLNERAQQWLNRLQDDWYFKGDGPEGETPYFLAESFKKDLVRTRVVRGVNDPHSKRLSSLLQESGLNMTEGFSDVDQSFLPSLEEKLKNKLENKKGICSTYFSHIFGKGNKDYKIQETSEKLKFRPIQALKRLGARVSFKTIYDKYFTEEKAYKDSVADDLNIAFTHVVQTMGHRRYIDMDDQTSANFSPEALEFMGKTLSKSIAEVYFALKLGLANFQDEIAPRLSIPLVGDRWSKKLEKIVGISELPKFKTTVNHLAGSKRAFYTELTDRIRNLKGLEYLDFHHQKKRYMLRMKHLKHEGTVSGSTNRLDLCKNYSIANHPKSSEDTINYINKANSLGEELRRRQNVLKDFGAYDKLLGNIGSYGSYWKGKIQQIASKHPTATKYLNKISSFF